MRSHWLGKLRTRADWLMASTGRERSLAIGSDRSHADWRVSPSLPKKKSIFSGRSLVALVKNTIGSYLMLDLIASSLME